jgi:hypothetical protein
MCAPRDEPLEALLGKGNCVGPRDADGVEAMLARSLCKRALERRSVVQKSRLA